MAFDRTFIITALQALPLYALQPLQYFWTTESFHSLLLGADTFAVTMGGGEKESLIPKLGPLSIKLLHCAMRLGEHKLNHLSSSSSTTPCATRRELYQLPDRGGPSQPVHRLLVSEQLFPVGHVLQDTVLVRRLGQCKKEICPLW